LKSKSGNLWAAIRGSKGDPLTLLYLLKKTARMRPRHIFARTRDTSRPQILEITRGAIRAVVQKANA